ncbi:MAG: hypothetical protein AAF730_14475 [Bacteroidota bacterium]
MSEIAYLDVAIGLIFIYLLFSLLASAINEAILVSSNERGRILDKVIRRMLSTDGEQSNDGVLYNNFSRHILYKSLKTTRRSHPPYLSCERFVEILLSVLADEQQKREILSEETNDTAEAATPSHASGTARTTTLEDVLSDSPVLQTLFKQAGRRLDPFRASLETWYDDIMAQASGWYKARVQVILFVIGLVLAGCFNVDTLSIASRLSQDPELRANLVEQAIAYQQSQKLREQAAVPPDLEAQIKQIDSMIEQDISPLSANLGLGWRSGLFSLPYHYYSFKVDNEGVKALDADSALSQLDNLAGFPPSQYTVFWPQVVQTIGPELAAKHRPDILNKFGVLAPWTWTKVGIGWLLTAIAISLGAPFWFDLLNKVINVRGANAKAQYTSSTSATPVG